MLEMSLAAERLKVRVLQPGGTGLVIREPLHVLEQMQPRHQPRRQAGPALAVRCLVLSDDSRVGLLKMQRSQVRFPKSLHPDQGSA